MDRENDFFHRRDVSWYLKSCEGRSIFSSHKVNGVVEDKLEKDQTKDDKENGQHCLKAKGVINTALGLDGFL